MFLLTRSSRLRASFSPIGSGVMIADTLLYADYIDERYQGNINRFIEQSGKLLRFVEVMDEIKARGEAEVFQSFPKIERVAEFGLLHVGVARRADPGETKRQLDQAGTVDTEG